MKPFVHFHVLTDSSIYASTLQYNEVFTEDRKCIALTDNHWCQIFEFHDRPFDLAKKLEKEKGIVVDPLSYKPIYGFKARVENVLMMNDVPQEILLVAKNEHGFKNLMYLTSLMYTSENEYLTWEQIRSFNSDLFCISGSLSTEIGFALYRNVNPDAIVDHLKDVFGNDLYLEVQEHYLCEPWERNATQYCLNRLDVPLLLTNEVRYLNREDAKRSCIYFVSSPKSVRPSMERSRFTYSSEFYLKTDDEMYWLAVDMSDSYVNGHRAYDAYDNTSILADSIEHIDLKAKGTHMPHVENAHERLTEIVYDRLHKVYPPSYSCEIEGTGKYVNYNDALSRIEYELNEISSKDYSGFFMILNDFVEECHDKDIILGVGRGSAVGSAVLYVLGVVEADPLEYGLLFERFLNPKRITEPDVDIDIESKRRGEALEYFTRRYGIDRISQILTIGTLSGKSAVRTVCKGLGVDLREEDRLAKLIPNHVGVTLQASLFGDGKSIEPDPNLLNEYDSNIQSKMIFDYALWIEEKNLISNFSIHAGGVVISKDVLTDYCPMIKGNALETCVNMTMKRVEKQGFGKYDILGVKILDVLKKCMKSMGFKSLRDIPKKDSNVYNFLNKGNTFGIFQFNNCGEIVSKMKVDSISDLTVITALNRPGPMAQIPTFIKRKHGESYDLFDPRLKDVLEPTFGIMVYQETIMQTAQVLCGYDLGEADLLRRAIGKKDRKIIEEERARFIDRAIKEGFTESLAIIIYDLIEFFCDYGFNKSHALAYAVTAYICAYFKHYIPVTYMSAMLEAHQNDAVDSDNSTFYLRVECEKMGISFCPPDVNTAEMSYSAVKDKNEIQYGLSSLKNVGVSQGDKIVANRPYSNLEDFVVRSGVSNSTIEALIKAGSFDSFGDRSSLLSFYDQMAEIAVSSESNFTVFDMLGDMVYDEVDPIGTLELLGYEKDILGTYLSEHPITYFKPQISNDARFSSAMEAIDKELKYLHIACIISKVKPWKKQNGCFATIEDETGSLQATIFVNTFEKLGIVNMKEICGKPIVLEGKYIASEGRIVVKDAYFMKIESNEIIIQINSDDERDIIKRITSGSKEGSTNLIIYDQEQRTVIESKNIIINERKKNELNTLFDGRIMIKTL